MRPLTSFYPPCYQKSVSDGQCPNLATNQTSASRDAHVPVDDVASGPYNDENKQEWTKCPYSSEYLCPYTSYKSQMQPLKGERVRKTLVPCYSLYWTRLDGGLSDRRDNVMVSWIWRRS